MRPCSHSGPIGVAEPWLRNAGSDHGKKKAQVAHIRLLCKHMVSICKGWRHTSWSRPGRTRSHLQGAMLETQPISLAHTSAVANESRRLQT